MQKSKVIFFVLFLFKNSFLAFNLCTDDMARINHNLVIPHLRCSEKRAVVRSGGVAWYGESQTGDGDVYALGFLVQ